MSDCVRICPTSRIGTRFGSYFPFWRFKRYHRIPDMDGLGWNHIIWHVQAEISQHTNGEHYACAVQCNAMYIYCVACRLQDIVIHITCNVCSDPEVVPQRVPGIVSHKYPTCTHQCAPESRATKYCAIKVIAHVCQIGVPRYCHPL